MKWRMITAGIAVLLIVSFLTYLSMRGDQRGGYASSSIDSALVQASFDETGADESSEINSSAPPSAPSENDKVGPSGDRERSDTEAVPQSLKRAFDAEFVQEMLEMLDALALQEPEYAQLRRKDLSHFCNPDVYGMQDEAVKNMRAKFCAGFDWENDRPPTQSEALSADAVDQTIQDYAEWLALHRSGQFDKAFRARLEREPENNRSAVFTELVRRARFPDEIILLMSINTQFAYGNSMRPLWQLGSELHQTHYRAADLLNAQNISLYLYACRRFGGCGLGQYWTLFMCSGEFANKCDRNSTLEDVLYQTTPPADFNLALEILLRLESRSAPS